MSLHSVINTNFKKQGGRAGVGTAAMELRSVEVLPAGADAWRWVPDLALPRTALGAAALDGRLYAVGGQVFTNRGSLYDMTHQGISLYVCFIHWAQSVPCILVPAEGKCGCVGPWQ